MVSTVTAEHVVTLLPVDELSSLGGISFLKRERYIIQFGL